MKKDIGNILFGFLHQKLKKNHISYFSTDKSEVRYFQGKIGGGIYPIDYQNNNIGHLFFKSFKSTLINGFYPIGLLLYDGSHYYMDLLKTHLQDCGLKPFACNTDCIYHLNDSHLYSIFKSKYPFYFDYTDVNSFDAIGKLKFSTTSNLYYKSFEPKMFHFTFSSFQPNFISLQNEHLYNESIFNDEIINILQKYNKLLFLGYGGYGKSTSILNACKTLQYKVLILTKCHSLSDKWKSLGFSSSTIDSFFSIRPGSYIPSSFSSISISHDVLIFDDFFLYDMKIIHQIYLLFHYPFVSTL